MLILELVLLITRVILYNIGIPFGVSHNKIHCVSQSKKDNEVPLITRYSIVYLFLSIVIDTTTMVSVIHFIGFSQMDNMYKPTMSSFGALGWILYFFTSFVVVSFDLYLLQKNNCDLHQHVLILQTIHPESLCYLWDVVEVTRLYLIRFLTHQVTLTGIILIVTYGLFSQEYFFLLVIIVYLLMSYKRFLIV